MMEGESIGMKSGDVVGAFPINDEVRRTEPFQNIPQIIIPPSDISSENQSLQSVGSPQIIRNVVEYNYRIHVLDNQGKIKRMYVFGGGQQNMQTIFSESELNEIKAKAIEVVFSTQQIHKDDSIRIIKKKIIQEIGEQEICYDEMYLFANVLESINTMSLYQLITQTSPVAKLPSKLVVGGFPPPDQNDSRIITYNHLKQLLLNMNINEDITDRKEQYLYEDILTWIEPHKKYPISIPIGQRFLHEQDYLFSCNPFKRVDSSIGGGGSDVGSVDFIRNSLVTFDNQLLLNYGKIHGNNIYLCRTEDVLSFTDSKGFDNEKTTQTYFPFLYKKSIITPDQFEENKQRLIRENVMLLDKATKYFFKTIDMFYNVYHGKTDELPYTSRGIKQFKIKINSEFKNILPLEVIFKNIHATQTIPFIKYNPGNRRENVYRLFTQHKTRDGKYIPYLSESVITKTSKEIGKRKQISLFIHGEQNIYMDIEMSGDVNVYAELLKPITEEELTILLAKIINPVIDNINVFLQQTGYNIRSIESLKENHIEIMDLKYVYEFILEKELNFNKYSSCISSVFDIIRDDEMEGTLMRFKRVENFQEMDAQTLTITETYKTSNNIADVIHMLMKNYKMSEDSANLRVVQYLSEHKDIRGKIVDNPGFPVLFKISKLDKKLTIEITDIVSLDYLPILHVYLDTMIRLTQRPDSTTFAKKEVVALCSKIITKYVEKVQVENVVSTTIFDKTIDVPQKIKPVELSDDDDDDDGEGGILFDEDEEDIDAIDYKETTLIKESPVSQQIQNVASLFDTDDEPSGIKKMDVVASQESSSSNEGIFFDDEEEDEEEELTRPSKDKKEKNGQGAFTPPTTNFIGDLRSPEKNGGAPKGKKIAMSEQPPLTVYNENDNDDEEKEFVINPVGKSLKNPNLFYTMMKARDPALFVSEEDGKYEGYSRICQSNLNIQPVVLTKPEFDKINKENPGSYTDYVKYGSNPEDPYYYICPRYWCLLNNTSMTAEDVQAGKCAKKGVPDKIIPRDAKKVPSDAFVYEFNNPKEHMNQQGEYIPHFPGFKKGKHPKGFGLPCCFKKPKQNWEYNQENVKIKKKKLLEKQAMEEKNISYIISNETFPIRQQHRFGFLPLTIQRFLQTDNNLCVTENNAALIKPNTECLLRYGIEQLPNQSIMGIIAELYAHSQALDRTPTVEEVKEIMMDAITIDDFIKYNNSYLISIFKPKKIDMGDIDISKYEDSEFYKSIDIDNELQQDFLEDTIASYENFLQFIRSDDSVIDHTYLWDAIVTDNPRMIKGGINLVLMEVVENDITDNVKILCPTNSQSNRIYDPRKETILVIKKENIYEPIYLYSQKDNVIKKQRTFFEQTAMKNIRKILSIIQTTTQKYCASQPSMPKVYKFKKNIYLDKLYALLKQHNYVVNLQIMNYQAKIIGLVVITISRKEREQEQEQDTDDSVDENNFIFVPCFPSASIPELKDIPLKFMDDTEDNDIWNDFENTVTSLRSIHKKSDGKIPCLPKFKVIDDKLIVGILTETNQFVQIDPPSENVLYDDLQEINSSNYLVADKVITNTSAIDTEREYAIKKISLESQFYSLFRTLVRNQLNQYENREMRQKIVDIYDGKRTYKHKMQKMVEYLKELLDGKVSFDIIDDAILMKLEELSCFSGSCDKQSAYCMKKDDGICELIVPNKHLISGVDNEKVYYGRVADELIRYHRVRLFMIQPKSYLNITNTDYSIRPDEFILIQTSINNNYFKDLVPFNESSNIVNVNYDTAIPQVSQTYSNDIIPINQQYSDANQGMELTFDFFIDCIKDTVEVIGNPRESLWKKIFPKKTKEIVFKNVSNNCTFYPLSYIFQDKYKEVISIQSVKVAIWNGYKTYYPKYKDQILKIWKKQGKKTIVANILKGLYTIETAILSEEYYLTDLDIWVFSENSKIQLCLFSKNGLKWIDDDIEWLIMGKSYRENHYFIRSPPIGQIPNKLPAYNLIYPSFGIGELGEFETMVQNAVSGKSKEYDKNIQNLPAYLSAQ